MKKNKNIILFKMAGIFFLSIFALSATAIYWQSLVSNESQEFGVTFSHLYANDLTGNWEAVYLSMLDDLNVKEIRIPVPWSVFEPENNQYSFKDLDFMMNEAASRGANVTLAVGIKVPRWPECYIPKWASDLSTDERNNEALDFLENVANRYSESPALQRWQVENESFFFFGECPMPDVGLYNSELELIRNVSPQVPIVGTTSGEQSIWMLSANKGDVLGASLYRTVWNEVAGYIIFPYRPEFYSAQILLSSIVSNNVIISELQAEPWMHDGLIEYGSVAEKYDEFTSEDLIDNVNFAKRTGADEIFLWGIEWWYHLKMNGESRLWDSAKILFLQD